MRQLELKPEQIIVPGEYELGSESILKIYFRIFDKGHGIDLPPVIVVGQSTEGQKNKEYLNRLRGSYCHIKNYLGYQLEELPQNFTEEDVNTLLNNGLKREIDAMNKYKIQDLVDYRFPELKRRYAQLIEKTSQASYYLIDGNHRAVAAALTHNPIYAIELQNDKDLNKVRKMVKCGELFEFNRDETSLQELVLEFDDYLLNNIEDCMTIQQRVDKLTSNGDLPEYIKIKYLENRI